MGRKLTSRRAAKQKRDAWTRLYAYRDRKQAIKAAKATRGVKGGVEKYIVEARVRKLPNGNWVVETRFGKKVTSHYGTKRIHE